MMMNSRTAAANIDDLGDIVKSKVVEVGKNPTAKIVVDEKKLRKFHNIIDFSTHPEGLGLVTLWEYTRQYQYLRDFYGLMCPRCNEPGPNPNMPYDAWGKSPAQLQEEILLIENNQGEYFCPGCKATRAELELQEKTNLLIVSGMRSGKTMLSAQILCYEVHRDLLLKNPQKKWGVAPGQEIYYSVASTQGEQTKDTIFAAIDGLMENSPWFQRYVSELRKRSREQEIPFDRVFVKNLSEIRFLDKQLFIDISGSNSAGLAGKTRKLVIIDEIARFISTESRMGVDLVYDTLKASLLTLSSSGAKMVCISSPMFKTDKIMRLYDDAMANPSEDTLVGLHATWDFNPKLPREHPFIVQRFREDPIAARRDFGADPPGALDPWMPDEWRIDECVDRSTPALIRWQDYTHALIIKNRETTLVAKKIIYKDIATTKHITISCDPGQKFDAFGMIIAYMHDVQTVRGYEPHLFVGASMAWEPSKNPRREVDLLNVMEVIKDIGKHWVLDKVIYDQWQSAIYIADLQSAGVDAEKIQLKPEDWDNLAALFYNKQIHLLHPDVGGAGAERLIWELKNLGLKENRKVDHSPTSSSDIAVCLARAAKVMLGQSASEKRVIDTRSSMIGRTVSFHRP